MMFIFRTIYKYFIGVVNSTRVFLLSLRLWKFTSWIDFWTTHRPQTAITAGPFQFIVRSRRLTEKLVDSYMVLSCIHDNQYSPAGFEIRPRDTILDIGGHIGSFSILAAKQAHEGHVYTYEPDPQNFPLLEKNIAQNAIPNITATHMAVSGKNEKIRFYHNALNSAESGFYGSQSGSSSLVQGITLDSIFETTHITTCDFLKIDCEGAEYDILFHTSEKTLAAINRIAMECHSPHYFNLPQAYDQAHMVAFLERAGFHVTEIKENHMHSLIFARRA